MKKILNILKNRYVLVALFMITWLGFFDRYNFIKRWQDNRDMRRVEQESEYYKKQIAEIRKKSAEFDRNKESMERFARERYYMKKDKEDVYIIEDEKPQIKDDK